ncbi:MAG TPA: hypothetical protein DEP87_04645 [Candidatus Pacebacteria bacterium]|nr:hypothetical protein [Candidatus Paceibacterota bacterium]
MAKSIHILKKLITHPLTRFGMAFILLYFVFRQTNLSELSQKLSTANPVGVGIYLIGSLIMAWLAGWRWATILVPRSLKVSDHWLFFKATMLGLFYNLFLPSNMGGDVMKWTVLDELKLSKKLVILTMIIDRVIGIFGLVTLGFGSLVVGHLTQLVTVPILMWQIMSVAFIGVIGFLILISTDWRWRQIPVLNRFNWIATAEAYLEKHRVKFWQAFGLAIMVQLVGVIIIYALGQAVGFKLNFWQFLVIEPILGTIVSLPLNFAGFGATEVGFVYFFGLFGEPSTTVLALTSLMGVMRIVMGGIGWLIGLVEKQRM